MAAPSKAELIASLEQQGIQLTGDETVADLKKLIEEHAEQITDPKLVEELQNDPEVLRAMREREKRAGIVKEWMHNGHKMQRVRDEDGIERDIKLT